MESINKLFTETLNLSAGIWMVILLAVVAVAFLVSLIAGLMTGEFKTVKGLMAQVVSKPSNALIVMKKMPTPISKQYKRARVANLKPSDYVTELECVYVPYAHSLISKVWLVTFVATVICAAIGFLVAPLAFKAAIANAVNTGEEVNYAVYENAQFIIPVMVLIVGGLLTLVGGILGRVFYGGAKKVYAKFVDAIDGDAGKPAEPVKAPVQNDMGGFAFEQPAAEPVITDSVISSEPVAEPVGYGDMDAEVEKTEQNHFDFGAEPVTEEPVAEPFAPEAPVDIESDEEIRMRAREEAIARMRAEQEAQEAARLEEEQARKAAEEEAAKAAAEAQARAEEQARAEAQAAAEAQAKAEAEAAAKAAQEAQVADTPTGTSSADDVIARIEKINREGAPRETMREVATLLQKERAKPENKTPEQQKKLNEALSKLLKAMSAASRK